MRQRRAGRAAAALLRHGGYRLQEKSTCGDGGRFSVVLKGRGVGGGDMISIDRAAFEQTRRAAVRRLLDERNEQGWWTGELSSSALSTATAVTALALVDRARGESVHRPLVDAGVTWLAGHQNDDGGWGDTDKSVSNISTTTLVWAAFNATGHRGACGDEHGDEHGAAMRRCEARLKAWTGSLDPPVLAEAIAARYGKDRTFSVPILMMCALSGRLSQPQSRDTWRLVKQLPFELAVMPRSWFGKLNLQVVSYALPALIAIGQVRHHFRPTRNPVARLLRNVCKRRTLELLRQIQPSSGGFLEATPLTSFVTMSLAACGLANHAVTNLAVDFLTRSARPDGSWAIDTNLATWVTTLCVNALLVNAPSAGRNVTDYLSETERRVIRDWLLGQQYTAVHPYTLAAPGGWAWTDLPGGVPDADDTSGAVLALFNLGLVDQRTRGAAQRGLAWLRSVQNRDGGIPTFCRGWGRLPFDRSSQDITAHFLRAQSAWCRPAESENEPRRRAVERATKRGASYLGRMQQADGSWTPLWFGNQYHRGDQNPLYGTARVWAHMDEACQAGAAARRWLLAAQNSDGGWGGGPGIESSIEETALAVEALAAVLREQFDADGAKPQAAWDAIARGVNWLIEHTQRGTRFDPAPIGFYFAKLWYYEKLYPIIFTVAALQRVAVLLQDVQVDESVKP